jgi:hypothetical protein
MITVTANAGASIARRNAVLAVIPKAQWWPLYERALKLAGGETKKEVSQGARAALAHFAQMGISEGQVLATIKVKKAADLNAEHVATLRGIATAIKSGETTVAKAFGAPEPKERKSEVEEVAPAKGPISQNEADDVYTLMCDRKLDVGKTLALVSHKGKINTLPKSKLAALLEKIGEK